MHKYINSNYYSYKIKKKKYIGWETNLFWQDKNLTILHVTNLTILLCELYLFSLSTSLVAKL